MGRKALLVISLMVMLPLLAAAEVVVLKDGRRIETRERYVIDAGVVKFTGKDGRDYSYPLGQVDLDATRRASRFAGKIWTNEDLAQLSGGGAISVTGTERAPEAAPSAEPGTPTEAAGEEAAEATPKEQDPEYWRKRLEPLRNELNQIEQQLQSLRRGQGQAASNAINVRTDAPGADVNDTVQRLERRRGEVQREIAAIQDEARRLGVPPGYVR